MCVVCVELAKGKLTATEAYRALAEMAMDPKQKDHVQEVIEEMTKKQEKRKNTP